MSTVESLNSSMLTLRAFNYKPGGFVTGSSDILHILHYIFFYAIGEYNEWRLQPTVRGPWAEDSVGLKTPPALSTAPGARSTVSRLNGSRQTVDPSRVADSSLAFF